MMTMLNRANMPLNKRERIERKDASTFSLNPLFSYMAADDDDDEAEGDDDNVKWKWAGPAGGWRQHLGYFV
jgi:hypothetical protein